jgi:hypothetical protein
MGVSLDVYRAAIGEFNIFKTSIVICASFVDVFVFVAGYLLMLFIACILIAFSNDIQLNPGPSKIFSIGQLNVRSLNVHEKFEEISFLIKDRNFDIFALTETWLNAFLVIRLLSQDTINLFVLIEREEQVGVLLSILLTYLLLNKDLISKLLVLNYFGYNFE